MSDGNMRKLPLLECFLAIMERGSLVAAAESMAVTQSAVSKQLAQLRTWFDDELFVRTTEGMQPTPRAMELLPRVESLLAQAADLTAEGKLSPSEFSGRFVLVSTDEVLQRLLPTLLERFASEAPQFRLVARPLSSDYALRELEDGQANLIVSVNWNAPETLNQKRLYSEERACVMHEEHEFASVDLTLDRYVAATHVLVAPLGSQEGVVDIALRKLDRKRRVCASIPSFCLLGESILGRSRIATVPSSVAARLAETGPFIIKPVPVGTPPSNYFALWHPRFSADPRLRWVLDGVERALKSS